MKQRLPANPPVGSRSVEVAILAGGLSTRMGRDKATLRFGRRTLLGHIRATAEATGWPVRVIRRDAVPGCGPLGGIYTALKRTRADAVVFLACDMPLVSVELLRKVVKALTVRQQTVFFELNGRMGFPFAMQRTALPVVEQFLADRIFSLQRLAAALKAKRIKATGKVVAQLSNANTPGEWEQMKQQLR